MQWRAVVENCFICRSCGLCCDAQQLCAFAVLESHGALLRTQVSDYHPLPLNQMHMKTKDRQEKVQCLAVILNSHEFTHF